MKKSSRFLGDQFDLFFQEQVVLQFGVNKNRKYEIG